MFALTRSTVWIGVAVAIGFGGHAAVSGQEADTTAASAREAPAQSLSEAAQISGNSLTLTDGEHAIHIFPTVSAHAGAITAGGPLTYHAGGSIMPRLNIYSIFWKPATLQNGKTAVMSAAYRTVLTNFAADYVGHGIHNNNTQYYQTIGGVTTYVSGLLSSTAGQGSNAGVYIDTASYPPSGCKDTFTPKNCITDAQLQTELQRVMALKGWTGGLDKIFLIYTAKGEGSCFDSTSSSCAYAQYCAYHGKINSGPIIYGNEPYGDATFCQTGGTPSPNANPDADTASTAASHEVTEAVTDPLLNAWFDSSGNEIGDLCAYQYASNTFDGSLANQSWNGHFYELQTEYDNHTTSCNQVGP